MNRIVGIGGVSCGGKTTLIKELVKSLPEFKVIHFDNYYIKTKDLVDPKTSWESPDHYNYQNYLKELAELIEPAIVEGFLIYHDPKARDLFDLKVYLDLPEEEILKRRIARGRGGESDALEYIQKELIPGQRKYVYPQKEFADLVLDAQMPIEVLAKEILSVVEKTALR